MHDAEMLLGLHRHLTSYSVVPATSALGELQFAGKVYELAFRLRGSGVSPIKRVNAIAVSAGISAMETRTLLLPTLETLSWIRVNRDKAGDPTSVEDAIPPIPELLASCPKVLDVASADGVQRAALLILRATTLRPLETVAALEVASAFDDEEAHDALRHLVAVNLVRELKADDGRSAVFNPNVWQNDETATLAALRVEDSHIRREVGALMEEVQASPGIPQEQVQSTETKWIDFAVSQGLIQRTVVTTETGDERKFLFTPHLQRDPFGVDIGDASGHVRQLVGSMIYAMTYPRFKLDNPAAFVRKLINNGQAGNASPIGTDYPMLETAGIVQVIPGTVPGRFSLALRQTDVAEAALRVLESREGTLGRGQSVGGLMSQNAYRHLESERAQMQLAVTAPTHDQDAARLVAALRQASRSTNA